MDIDHELRNALRRKQAPDDFAERVLERVGNSAGSGTASGNATPSRTHGLRLPQTGVTRWLAAAAVLTLTVGGAGYYTSRQQAAENERVREELRVALQITNEAVARVQSKLSRPATTVDGKRTP